MKDLKDLKGTKDRVLLLRGYVDCCWLGMGIKSGEGARNVVNTSWKACWKDRLEKTCTKRLSSVVAQKKETRENQWPEA